MMIDKREQGLTEKEFLQQYDDSKYEKPSVTVDMLIFTVMDEEEENYRKLPEKKLKLLLIKRGNHPFMGKWALPGGFAGLSESLDDSALRELREETNIENVYMEQLYTWGEVKRDPRTRIISCSYMALVDNHSLNVKAGDDAQDAKWFTVNYNILESKVTQKDKGFTYERLVEIILENTQDRLSAKIKVINQNDGKTTKYLREIVNSEGIAFDHGKIIEYAVERLRNKIEYTDIAFNLMPPLFTLSELQKVYEVVLGKELLVAAFRRKISHMVVETEKYTKNAGHRPSKLYRFNPLYKKSNIG